IVTCAAPDLPSALLEQLQEGGRLIIPVNINNNNLSPDILDSATQQLQIVTKSNDKYIKTSLELVKFVPLLTGKQ
nr:hypothetical protein [Gammaproteobacteria bacterium]